jgi:hypothetical protein
MLKGNGQFHSVTAPEKASKNRAEDKRTAQLALKLQTAENRLKAAGMLI